ncbi:MAG: FKBP-type peptidyl-prolyl cis-trans isomerase [Armatimonadetes bacterium]|nr:FKBP-type peptidyl-prolyl cis-trans isomerase [Armatimonadota bacterium]
MSPFLVLALLLSHPPQDVQVNLSALAGKVVDAERDGQLYMALIDYLDGVVQGRKRLEPFSGAIHVWRRRERLIVVREHHLALTPGDSKASVYQFDDSGKKLLAYMQMSTGWRMDIESTTRIDLSVVSDLVFRIDVVGWAASHKREYYAFDGDRVVLVRAEGADGELSPNRYGAPNHTIGPSVPKYDKLELIDLLQGSNQVSKLEALTWLIGVHLEPSHDLNPVFHEDMADAVRYWTLSQDSDVRAAVRALEKSSSPWVAQSAQYFMKHAKTLATSRHKGGTLTRVLKVEDLEIGKGTWFCPESVQVVAGDRAVIEYQGKMPDGTVFESTFGSKNSPNSIIAGEGAEIDGLTTGILGMRAGGKRKLTIPASMAYGSVGAGMIPPNCDLVYTVRVVHIIPGDRFEKPIFCEVKFGTGPQAAWGSRVTFKWKAYLITGREIKSNTLENPKTLNLTESFPGEIGEALVGMKRGGLRKCLVWQGGFRDATDFGYSRIVMQIELLSVIDSPGR